MSWFQLFRHSWLCFFRVAAMVGDMLKFSNWLAHQPALPMYLRRCVPAHAVCSRRCSYPVRSNVSVIHRAFFLSQDKHGMPALRSVQGGKDGFEPENTNTKCCESLYEFLDTCNYLRKYLLHCSQFTHRAAPQAVQMSRTSLCNLADTTTTPKTMN